ncbi:glycosyltransferase involved in cell wall biosynthesis [Paraburkholderia sp. RAU6.4a]|uniref:glycosyltransferase n=1 Tax=Paraburkholderia sp. RAU6.4a TaxID=2991067 RepID=UPI003D1E4318
MRVVHVYRTYFPDPPGGLQEAIRQIALSTRERGVDPRILTLSPSPTLTVVERPEGQVIREKSWAAPASCDLGGTCSVIRYREMADWADVVHFHFPWPFADVLHLLGRTKKPTVMTYQSDIVRQKLLEAVYGPLMRRTLRAACPAVVATSPAYAQTSETPAARLLKERLKTISLGIIDYRGEPQPVDAQRKLESWPGLAPGEPYFLALGVLRYYKGLHTLVEAGRHVQAKIVIAGSGRSASGWPHWRGSMARVTSCLPGRSRMRKRSRCSRGCRAMVLPSHLRSEAFGMVPVEAAMFSKPMVCCEVGSGASFVNEDGVTGFVVPPEAPEPLIAAINRLALESTAARHGGGRAAAI